MQCGSLLASTFCLVGGKGKGRALGVGEVKFTGQILPTAKKVTTKSTWNVLLTVALVMGLADGRVLVDGKEIYVAKDLKVGLSKIHQHILIVRFLIKQPMVALFYVNNFSYSALKV